MSSTRKHLFVYACLAAAVCLAAGQQAIPPQMKELFPVGRTFKGVKIPSYSGDTLKSILESDTITRRDKDHLDLTNLVVKAFNGEGKVESTIKMDEAQYFLKTGELRSKTPARIDHEKFVMTGDEMKYDTGAETSTLTGNVRVVIPNAKEFTGNFGMDALDSK